MNSSLNRKTNMEYTLQEYKRREGKVFTTSDGHKYIRSKITEKYLYLKCALFRQNDCKGTGRLNRETNLITPLTQHHHSNEDYQSNIFDLKAKCKTLAKHTQTNLRKVFDDATRTDPSAHDVSFAECEAAMYRARRTLQPKIPQSASEFSEMLSSTHLGTYHKFTVTCDGQTGVVLFSDQMKTFMAEVTNIQFDGTFYTVPNQFYQLWTVFVSVGRNTLPAIHCLLTAKNQELYQAVLESLKEHIPLFTPIASMSDWEPASRNAFRQIYPQIRIFGCWFHYTQRIWGKTQKLGLIQEFKDKPQVKDYIRNLMALPFLPAALINPTFTFLELPTLDNITMMKLDKLSKYFKKRWVNQISSEELSIFELDIATNNAAESYHSKLKTMIKTAHPRIWTFLDTLNEVIQDTDNEIGRLCLGKEITRQRKRKVIKNDDCRRMHKQKLREGNFTPMEYVQAISHTIGNISIEDSYNSSDSEFSEGESPNDVHTQANSCVVCLSPRATTWIFMPCRHANCCSSCSQQIIELGQPCPVCRANIETRFQIFTS